MPCPFTGPKMFWAGPSFLSQTKNLTASSKTFVLPLNPILKNANRLFVTVKKIGLAQKIWNSPKYFGTCKENGRPKYLQN
jgi:hypothetical protein